jgi:hypothetical protein
VINLLINVNSVLIRIFDPSILSIFHLYTLAIKVNYDVFSIILLINGGKIIKNYRSGSFVEESGKLMAPTIWKFYCLLLQR